MLSSHNFFLEGTSKSSSHAIWSPTTPARRHGLHPGSHRWSIPRKTSFCWVCFLARALPCTAEEAATWVGPTLWTCMRLWQDRKLIDCYLWFLYWCWVIIYNPWIFFCIFEYRTTLLSAFLVCMRKGNVEWGELGTIASIGVPNDVESDHYWSTGWVAKCNTDNAFIGNLDQYPAASMP